MSDELKPVMEEIAQGQEPAAEDDGVPEVSFVNPSVAALESIRFPPICNLRITRKDMRFLITTSTQDGRSGFLNLDR